MESGDDSVEDEDENNLMFFISKDQIKVWSNNAVSARWKTKSKNIVKIFPSPKIITWLCKKPLESFLQIITSELIDDIVKYTHLFIVKNGLKTNHLELQVNHTNRNLITIKKGNRSNVSEFQTKNGTGLMMC